MRDKHMRKMKLILLAVFAFVALLAILLPKPGMAANSSKTMPALVVLDDLGIADVGGRLDLGHRAKW